MAFVGASTWELADAARPGPSAKALLPMVACVARRSWLGLSSASAINYAALGCIPHQSLPANLREWWQ